MESKQKNILFIMLDQQRWDSLSCYGHPVVETPNIDRIAAKGVRYTNAYVQGTSCGNSRASYYTGRHVRSHGATWNDWPFRIDEWTLADYLKPTGLELVLLGKTHMKPDLEGMKRLNIDPQSELGRYLTNAGFIAGEHDDGLHPEGPLGRYSPVEPRYNQYLREKGFEGANPWLQWANSGLDNKGVVRNGFYMENAALASRLPAEYTETAYMTDRALETIEALKGKPWCIHLSYIKPHWPYIAPAPYHRMYREAPIPAAIKHESERKNPHPIYAEFMKLGVAKTLSDDAKRAFVLPAYYGLIKQIDDELGRLFAYLKEQQLEQNTLVVITADHGDYFGDHWLGEKDLFHEAAVKVPLIIYDPSHAAEGSRGQVCDDLVAAIDLIPTFLDFLEIDPCRHRLEGHSLLPGIRQNETVPSREVVISEADYGRLPVAKNLGRTSYNARMTMSFDGQYKFIHCPGFAPMLFDLKNDPDEFYDLGQDPGYEAIRYRQMEQMLDWSAVLKNRSTVSEKMYADHLGKSLQQGIIPGFWSREEVPANRLPPEYLQVF